MQDLQTFSNILLGNVDDAIRGLNHGTVQTERLKLGLPSLRLESLASTVAEQHSRTVRATGQGGGGGGGGLSQC